MTHCANSQEVACCFLKNEYHYFHMLLPRVAFISQSAAFTGIGTKHLLLMEAPKDIQVRAPRLGHPG
jgi:hypothetical protein